jgi:hypothetical protein
MHEFCRANAFKKGIMNMRNKLYNKLPGKIKEVEYMRQLKRDLRSLRSYLLQHTSYFIDVILVSRI